MQTAVHRIEVRPHPGMADPRGAAALREAQSLGLKRPPRSVESASIYLIEGPLSDRQIAQLAEELLTDPITEQATIGASRPKADSMIEVHPLPGVMDPDSEAVQSA
ncbi:MAG: phosphoribosylformylglycinamidine synthase subunit PurS, partial [Phycisphaerales bacterium]|nr:phosphoribosylformylglycinamidine synthase subunit PurS [Phycisphaerales bacterium]